MKKIIMFTGICLSLMCNPEDYAECYNNVIYIHNNCPVEQVDDIIEYFANESDDIVIVTELELEGFMQVSKNIYVLRGVK